MENTIKLEELVSKELVIDMYNYLVSIGSESLCAETITGSLWENEEGAGNENDLTEWEYYELVLPFVENVLGE